MTKEETKKAIEVMQAFLDGELIEARVRGPGKWILVGCDPDWRWDIQDYRIKPEPMEIEVWVKGSGPVIPINSAYAEPAFVMEQKGWTKKKFKEVLE